MTAPVDPGSTPRLSIHARARCVEMEVSTKRVKRIVINADVRYQQSTGVTIARWDEDPTLAVVYVPGAPPVVVTVVFATPEEYVRDGSSFVVVQPS